MDSTSDRNDDNATIPRSDSSPRGRRAVTIVKWSVMALAIGYLWHAGVFSLEHLAFSESWMWGLPAAAGLIALSTATVGIRFHCLLRRLGCPSTIPEQLKINFSALLAQQVGSEAGYDIVRIVGVRAMGGRGEDILAALMTDRLLGVWALTGISAAGLALCWNDTGWIVPTLVLVALLFMVPAAFLLCRWLEENRPHSRAVKIPGVSFLAATGTSLLRYRQSRTLLGALLLASIASHFCIFMALYCCGISLAGISISPREAVIGGALASFTGALPLPLAGLGVGEVAFGGAIAHLRRGGGVVAVVPVFLVNRLLVLLLGIAGWAWMTLSGKRGGVNVPKKEGS